MKMEMHKLQLAKIKMTSKVEEYKKRLTQQSDECKKIKREWVPNIDQACSEQHLDKLEAQLFKGIQKIN